MLRFLQGPPLQERPQERIRQILKRRPESLRGQVLRLQEREQARLMTTRHHQLQLPRGPLERAPIRRQSFPRHRVVEVLRLRWREPRKSSRRMEQRQPNRWIAIHCWEREQAQKQKRIHPCPRLAQRYQSLQPSGNRLVPSRHLLMEALPSRSWPPS